MLDSRNDDDDDEDVPAAKIAHRIKARCRGTTACCTFCDYQLRLNVWLICSDIDDMMTVVQESQKVFDINPWDFEPDFYPPVGQFRAIMCFITFDWISCII